MGTSELSSSIESLDLELSQAYLTRDHSIGVVIPEIDEFEIQEQEFEIETYLKELDNLENPYKFQNPMKPDRET